MRKCLFFLLVTSLSAELFAQNHNFDNFEFLLGEWKGKGTGFGNEGSVIESKFQLIMDKAYIQVKNNSEFAPTAAKPEGGKHAYLGIISFDKKRKRLIYRQFNNEGYVNQYVLNETLSTLSTLIFETERIENFVEGGKARWTIKKISDTEIETIFDVSMPGKEYACFGTNRLSKK